MSTPWTWWWSLAPYYLLLAALSQWLARRLNPALVSLPWRLFHFLWPALVLLCPMHGLPMGGYLVGLNGHLSIVSTGVLLVGVVKPAAGKTILNRIEWRVLFIFGAIFGMLTIPGSLGLAPWNLYEFGWRNDVLWYLALGMALVAIAFRSRVAYFFLAACATYCGRWLESTNFCDYLVDPILMMASLAALATMFVKWIRHPRTA